MHAYKISKVKLKHAKTTVTSFVFADNCNNDASCLIELLDDVFQEFDIKGEVLHNYQSDQFTTSRISTMDLREITDENDYQTCVRDAHTIKRLEKSLFCPNFYNVFYAELEINLNRFFTTNSREQWSLLFVDYNFMPPIHINNDSFDMHRSAKIFFYEPHILTILYNAKIKYCCRHCRHEWTTVRGRAIFQAEIPEINKYNILFAHLFTQKCQICRQDTEPSWYVDEATRVMKNVCRILMDKFYSDRRSRSSSSSSSSSEDDFVQRSSHMKKHHHRDLCRACQEGSCYG